MKKKPRVVITQNQDEKADVIVKILDKEVLKLENMRIYNQRKIGKEIKGTLKDGREVSKQGKNWVLFLK